MKTIGNFAAAWKTRSLGNAVRKPSPGMHVPRHATLFSQRVETPRTPRGGVKSALAAALEGRPKKVLRRAEALPPCFPGTGFGMATSYRAHSVGVQRDLQSRRGEKTWFPRRRRIPSSMAYSNLCSEGPFFGFPHCFPNMLRILGHARWRESCVDERAQDGWPKKLSRHS